VDEGGRAEISGESDRMVNDIRLTAVRRLVEVWNRSFGNAFGSRQKCSSNVAFGLRWDQMNAIMP
jgi:hypothetical protein